MKLDTTKITDVVMEGVQKTDAPEFCNAYIVSAKMEVDDKGTLRELMEEELDTLNSKHRDFVHSHAEEDMQCQGDYYGDMAKEEAQE